MSRDLGLPTLAVVGHGFFSTHHACASDAERDVRCEVRKPKFDLLVARARRFTSLVTQMHVEVCGQALARHPLGTRAAPHAVFASHHGELQIAADLVTDLLTLKSVSSARFALSVHNAPSGLFSIATKNTFGSTTVTAGAASFAAGLLETFLIAKERTRPVLLSYADEPIPAIFGGGPEQVGSALSLLLEREGEGPPADPMRSAIELASALDEGRACSIRVGNVRPGAVLAVSFEPEGRRA